MIYEVIQDSHEFTDITCSHDDRSVKNRRVISAHIATLPYEIVGGTYCIAMPSVRSRIKQFESLSGEDEKTEDNGKATNKRESILELTP